MLKKILFSVFQCSFMCASRVISIDYLSMIEYLTTIYTSIYINAPTGSYFFAFAVKILKLEIYFLLFLENVI